MGAQTGIECLFGQALPRKCRKCGTVKDIAEFKIDRSRNDGRGYVCRACERVRPGIPTPLERSAARKASLAWCKDCSEWLPAHDVLPVGRCRPHLRAEERRRYASDEQYRQSRRGRGSARRRGVDPVPPHAREAILEELAGLCAYCDDPATTWDHVIPVTKGGQTTPDNILPACVVCNSSKRNRDLILWLETTGRSIRNEAVARLALYGADICG